MPSVIETTVFQFDELDDKAREQARDWWRQHVFSDSNDWDHIYNDAKEAGEMFGLELDDRQIPLMNGKTRSEPCIYFSGFSSQGDGACFEGSYRYKKGGLAAIMKEWPKATDLHSIVKRLQDVQRRHFYRLRATCRHSGHYYHSGCMSVDVTLDTPNGEDYPSHDVDAEVTDCLREFADWIYEMLENEHDYQMSDENVDENIKANEYTFTAEGRRFG